MFKIGPFTIGLTKAFANLVPISSRGSWWPVIRESYTGAWQSNVEVVIEDVLTNPIVYACIRLIASDIGKLHCNLVAEDENGIWTKTESPAFSPVLKKPNHYQVRNAFFEQWMFSKLIRGNTYILKQRDQRNVVVAMYVLDPTRVTVLVAPDGSVYYDLKRDDLSNMPQDQFVVPASEIIHDQMTAFYHPLAGLSPLSAAGVAATQGLHIQENSSLFFGNGSNPGGVLTAPGAIADATAARLKAYWDTNFTGANVGKVAVLGDGLRYEPLMMKAVDAQLVEQWNATALAICSAIGVPAYKVGVGPAPTYNNIEALNLAYYTDCLQPHIEKIEELLDHGLELKKPYGTEFDLDDLLRMDTATRVAAAQTAVRSGMSPNEVRFKFYDLGPVPGGDTPFFQQQDWPLSLIEEQARQSLANAASRPSLPEVQPQTEKLVVVQPQDVWSFVSRFGSSLHKKMLPPDEAAA